MRSSADPTPKAATTKIAASKPASLAGAHTERHFRSSDTVRDIVLGMADGLTVPFALAAGISGALGAASAYGTSLIVTAGLAEIAAGSIAMGLGGYLSARAERDHYEAERRREETEILEKPAHERREIIEIMETYGVSEQDTAPLIAALERQPERWRDFMMRFELGLEEPDPRRALRSAVTIAVSYVVGGLIPLSPYFVMPTVNDALRLSVGLTLAALLVFGYVKGRFTGARPVRSALQTVLIGGLAAAAAFAIAKAIA